MAWKIYAHRGGEQCRPNRVNPLFFLNNSNKNQTDSPFSSFYVPRFLAVYPEKATETISAISNRGIKIGRKILKAKVESWADTIRIQDTPVLSGIDVGCEGVSEVAREAAEKFILLRKSSKKLKPGQEFQFVSTRFVDHDENHLAPAIFYELADGSGWVHDFALENEGERAIKVKRV